MSTDRKRWSRGRPLVGAEVEELLLQTMDELDDAHELLAEAAMDARKGEAVYRVAYAREYLNPAPQHKTEEARRQAAVRKCETLLIRRKEAEASEVAAKDLCQTRRSDLDALRSLIASARAAETGRG